MLGALRHEWCPTAMVVSFKLETDIQILLQKVGRDGNGRPGWIGHAVACV